MKQIVYVGLKEIKGDNVAQTGFTWTRGQVRDVDDEKANKLLKHPMIWADATGKTPEQINAMLQPELRVVEPTPVVSLVTAEAPTDPFPVVVPAEILAGVRKGELMTVFLSEGDIDAFREFKEARAKALSEPGPKKTGPKPQAKETKLGLDAAGKAKAA